ncbi:MAG TPA: nicotinate-nucleotide--dimethylbenzimidazole phosphoribosyltransferase [Fibrobacteraceae bacterium]|nr:nicotinate-nucleotide--dimethylbenzimidazole phosphoribosyltransferase [Fibrobacteraceae bacterium]
MTPQMTLEQTLKRIGEPDAGAREKARHRLERLTMPHWALGRILDLAEQLCAISGKIPPPVARRTLVIMAGDHGVAEEGVTLYPQEVTAQMIANFVAGGAGANALAKVGKVQMQIVDLGVKADLSELVRSGKVLDYRVAPGTANMATGPAMTRDQALQALQTGILIAQGLADENDILTAGEMGIANTTPATAILCALAGVDPAQVTGAGTGLDDAGRRHKADVIRKALACNQPDSKEPLDVLTKVGGLEIAGITGFYLGAAAARKVVVVDGFICSSAALLAQAFCPRCTQFMVAAHRSAEVGHGLMIDTLGLQPLLNLGFRLGEGTGACMAMPLFDAARSMLTDVATFEEASVSDKDAVPVK